MIEMNSNYGLCILNLLKLWNVLGSYVCSRFIVGSFVDILQIIMIDIRETSQRCNTVQFVLGPKQKTDCVRFIFVKMIQGVFQNYTNVHKGFVVWPVGLGLPCWCLVCFHLWYFSEILEMGIMVHALTT